MQQCECVSVLASELILLTLVVLAQLVEVFAGELEFSDEGCGVAQSV